jgi:hypothetical protein
MEINRNQWFLAGLVVLALGVQFRMVDSFTLNAEASQFVATQFKSAPTEVAAPGQSYVVARSPAPLRTVTPPKWLGWSLISVAAVLILHSLAMKRPG